MSKFKIGQRVLCVEQPDHYDERDRILHRGRMYTVIKIIDGHYVSLKEIKRPHNFRDDRFELANDILPEELFEI